MSTIEDRVIEIAEKLEAEGVNPTQVTVRDALGGGSFATIGPILKKWKEAKKEDTALAEVQVPEAITERLEQLQGAVWQAAVGEADRRLSAEREALHQAQDRAAAEVAEHLEIIKALESEGEDYQAKIEALEISLGSLDADCRNAKAELAEVKDRAETDRQASVEALIKETERREAAEARADRAEVLHREAMEQSRADLAALRHEHKAELEAVKRGAGELVKDANAQKQEQAQRAAKAEKDGQLLASSAQDCQHRLGAAQREVEQSRERMAILETKAEKATTEAAELRGELKALSATDKKKG